MRLWKYCTILNHPDGQTTLHLHGSKRKVRQMLYVTPYGAEYEIPLNADEKVFAKVLSMDWMSAVTYIRAGIWE